MGGGALRSSPGCGCNTGATHPSRQGRLGRGNGLVREPAFSLPWRCHRGRGAYIGRVLPYCAVDMGDTKTTDERKQNARVQEQTERNKRTSSVINTITDLKEVLRGGYSLSSSCLSMKVRSPMPCSCSCLSPTRSQRRRRELHGADSDMAQRLETAMAHTLRLGSLAELHG